ncbi:hypothetical protein IG631_08886 [Alternaria alternata]|nr:hypothetical protein IG631_08886 [Alternaria alternata]
MQPYRVWSGRFWHVRCADETCGTGGYTSPDWQPRTSQVAILTVSGYTPDLSLHPRREDPLFRISCFSWFFAVVKYAVINAPHLLQICDTPGSELVTYMESASRCDASWGFLRRICLFSWGLLARAFGER